MTLGMIAVALVGLFVWGTLGLVVAILFVIPFVIGLASVLSFVLVCCILLYIIGKY